MRRVQLTTSVGPAACAALIGAAGLLTGCNGHDAAAPRPQPTTAPAPTTAPKPPTPEEPTAPTKPVTVTPGGPEAHPLAPESVPNKPTTIPEEAPGSAGAR